MKRQCWEVALDQEMVDAGEEPGTAGREANANRWIEWRVTTTTMMCRNKGRSSCCRLQMRMAMVRLWKRRRTRRLGNGGAYYKRVAVEMARHFVQVAGTSTYHEKMVEGERIGIERNGKVAILLIAGYQASQQSPRMPRKQKP